MDQIEILDKIVQSSPVQHIELSHIDLHNSSPVKFSIQINEAGAPFRFKWVPVQQSGAPRSVLRSGAVKNQRPVSRSRDHS